MISASSSGCSVEAAASALLSAGDGGEVTASTVSARPILPQTASRPRSACSAWITAASLVTAAVTFGLPSRSPPTQEPNRRNGGTGEATVPLSGPSSTWSSAR